MKVTGSSIQQLDKYRPDGRPKPKSECRRWRLWVTTEQGKKSRRFKGTYTKAQAALADFVSEAEALIPNAETFSSYAEQWRRWREEAGDLSPNTVAVDRVSVNALNRTALADMRMGEITPPDCREALLWLKVNTVNGDGRKPSSLAKLHQVLTSIMAQAVADGKLASNPMASVKRPKSQPKEKDALSKEELIGLLDELDSMPVDGKVMAVYLMACLGLRCGEACALRDGEVSDVVNVTSTVRAADNSVGPPKSKMGARTLPAPDRLLKKVEEWRAVKPKSEWLCCTDKGGRMSTAMMSNWWRGDGKRGMRDKVGCTGMTLHQLRHSNLSMIARYMSPFDLQRYAGWSSIEPARIYIHDDLDAVARAVKNAW